jgi:antitoxin VapB
MQDKFIAYVLSISYPEWRVISMKQGIIMNRSRPIPVIREEIKTARLFRNGVNQAIRIPREFELPGTEVIIRRVAGTLVIESIEMTHPQGSVAALLAALATLEPITEPVEPFPNTDEGLLSVDHVEL